MTEIKARENCYGCKVSRGKGGVNERGGTIELPGGWILNHYGLEEGFLGYLALQTKKHRESFVELLTNEAVALGGNIKDVHMALSDYWSQHFPEDPLERIYVVYFSEHLIHLHFHLIPRPKSFGKLRLCSKVYSKNSEIEKESYEAWAWKVYLASKCEDFPHRYRTKNEENKEEVLKLIGYLKEKL